MHAARIISTCLLLCVLSVHAKRYSDKLLLISLDGFRHDYLARTKSPYLKGFAQQGVSTTMNVTYITLTFPCHFTMVTGLWQEEHGIIANNMYDPEFKEFFSMRTIEDKWWSGGEPIWITAKRQSKRSATFFWPGSEAKIGGLRPDFYMKYNTSYPYRERIDTVVNWFTNDNINIATLYFNEPDSTGHSYGPNSQQVLDKVEEMDGHIGYLISKLRDARLYEDMNIIITSDHGMEETSPDKFIDLSECVNRTDVYRIGNFGPTTSNIIPRYGKEELIFTQLKNCHPNLTVSRKEDLPERWHYKNNKRVLQLIAFADVGFQLLWDKSFKWQAYGQHGYDNTLRSMDPFFLARGPNIKAGFVPKMPLRQVDLYPMMCELLNLNPAPHNGSLAPSIGFLKEYPPISVGVSLTASGVLGKIVVALSLISVWHQLF